MNMLLHGAAAAATIAQGDTLFAPEFLEAGGIRQFELIIANPPFSSKNWGHDKLKAGDPFGRIRHVPPKKHGEMAFVQHMVASLASGGRMAVVLPNGALFRARGERATREDLVAADFVEAVIQLPKDMFYGAEIPACFVVLNRSKPPARKGRVLFIDASERFTREDGKNVLQESDIDAIVDAYRTDGEEPGFSVLVANDEIATRRYSLSVQRYVRAAHDGAGLPDVGSAVRALAEARRSRREAEHQLDILLRTAEAPLADTASPAASQLPPIEDQTKLIEAVTVLRRNAATSRREASAASSLLNAMRQSLIDELDHPVVECGEVLLGIEAGKSPKCEERMPKDGEDGVLKVSAIRPGEFRPDEAKVLPAGISMPAKAAIRDGDILICRANTPSLVGSVCQVEEAPPRLYLSDKTLRLILDADRIHPAYFVHVMASATVREQIELAATGTSDSMRNLSQVSIRDLELPLPSVATQRDIAQRLNAAVIAVRTAEAQEYVVRNLEPVITDDVLANGHVTVEANTA
jgi:hypothetical protein